MMQHNRLVGFPIGTPRGNEGDRKERLARLRRWTESAQPLRWFAVRVMTGREKAVENDLEQLGVTALVPMRKGPDLRRRGRVIEGQMMPVIHGYVIVNLPRDGVILAGLQAVEHFVSLLGGYDNPMAITAQEVSRFKALADEGAYDWERPTGKALRSGDTVKLYDGPFVGMGGEVISCRSDGRGDVVVLLDMLGGKVPVTVPLAICEKL